MESLARLLSNLHLHLAKLARGVIGGVVPAGVAVQAEEPKESVAALQPPAAQRLFGIILLVARTLVLDDAPLVDAQDTLVE